MRWSLLAVLVCALASSTVVGVEIVTVGGTVMPIPDGWRRADQDDAAILTPREPPAGAICTFTLLGGEPFKGTVKDQMEAEWKAFAAMGTLAGDTGLFLDGAGGPLEFGARSVRIDNPGKQSAFIFMFLVKTNGRLEKMVMVANGPDAMRKYAADAEGMVHAAKYVLPKPPESLKGVCLGFARVKTSLEPECWIFLPDGIVYQGFPYGGPDGLDLALQRKRSSNPIGTYQSSGGEVVVTMTGEKTPTRFSISDSAWTAPVTRQFHDKWVGVHGTTRAEWMVDVPTTLSLTRADPCDGMRLPATYRTTPPQYDHTIRFTGDGGFADDGLVHEIDPGTLGPTGSLKPTAAPEKGGVGTYAIARNTLALTYTGGTKVNLTFFVSNDQLQTKPPAWILTHRAKLVLVK